MHFDERNISFFCQHTIKIASMKNKIFLSLLLVIAILSITIGSNFLPLWAWTITLLFSLMLFFLIIYKIYENDKKSTETFRTEILNVVGEQSEKILCNIEQGKRDTLHMLGKVQDEISCAISASCESLTKMIDSKFEETSKEMLKQESLLTTVFSEQLHYLEGFKETVLNNAKVSSDQLKDISGKISSESQSLISSINSSNAEMRKHLGDVQVQLTENLNHHFEDLRTTTGDSLTIIKDCSAKQYDSVMQQFRNLSEKSIELNNVVIQSVSTASEKSEKLVTDIASKVVECEKEQERSYTELKDMLNGKTTRLQETFVATVSATKDSIVDEIKKVDDSHNKTLTHLSGEFASKLEVSQHSIEHSVTEITNRVDAIKESNEDLKVQSRELFSIVKNSIDESNNATEVFLDEVKGHSIQTNQLLSAIQIKVENVESGVSAMSCKNEEQTITESVKNIIAELKKELMSSLSTVNDRILDTQIAQEKANDELWKLQELLRILSLPAISHSIGNGDLSSNRLESIVDPETHNEVLNQYDGDKLAKSSMKDTNGHLIYEIEYKAGAVARTRNYDSEGKLNIEQTFFENGQVHYRTEYTSAGKKTTEFDINGNKK